MSKGKLGLFGSVSHIDGGDLTGWTGTGACGSDGGAITAAAIDSDTVAGL
jgi:hypothetical protein